jgi:hypothetical protein
MVNDVAAGKDGAVRVEDGVERAQKSAELGATFGDRRQELVLIGYFGQSGADSANEKFTAASGGGEAHTEDSEVELRIRKLLDSCLLTDRELEYYMQQQLGKNLLA